MMAPTAPGRTLARTDAQLSDTRKEGKFSQCALQGLEKLLLHDSLVGELSPEHPNVHRGVLSSLGVRHPYAVDIAFPDLSRGVNV